MPRYTAQDFIDAIPGTGGIITQIARSVGCSWHTAKKALDKYVTVKEAYDAERELVLDVAENTLITSIRIQGRLQARALENGQDEEALVDLADIKWYLKMKGHERGYAERKDLRHSGPDGEPMDLNVLSIFVYGEDLGEEEEEPE